VRWRQPMVAASGNGPHVTIYTGLEVCHFLTGWVDYLTIVISRSALRKPRVDNTSCHEGFGLVGFRRSVSLYN